MKFRSCLLISAISLVCGCTTADKDYVREHIALGQSSSAKPLPDLAHLAQERTSQKGRPDSLALAQDGLSHR